MKTIKAILDEHLEIIDVHLFRFEKFLNDEFATKDTTIMRIWKGRREAIGGNWRVAN